VSEPFGATQAGKPEDWRRLAQEAAARGDIAQARAILENGVTEFPDNAALANSAGHFAMQAKDAAAAEGHFARAVRLAPGSLEFATNRAVALARLERHGEALAQLKPFENAGVADARYCSARAAASRAVGDLTGAQLWYDRCLALEPGHARALHGRARVALERGAVDAATRFEQALAAKRNDPEAWLGLANALGAAGESQRARQIAETLVRQAPRWLDALRLLAQLRLSMGEEDFASHYAHAAQLALGDPAIPLAHADVLSGLGRHAEAAAITRAARTRFAGNSQLALAEAIHAGAAGDDARAEAVFASLSESSPERFVHEARHRIRRGELRRADTLLDRAAERDRWNIGIWALRGIIWRLAGDRRAEWLHGTKGLMRMVALPDAARVLDAAIPLLHRLHDGSALPLGQSLRGGTQTRGQLFARAEPQLGVLHDALMIAVEEYRSGLPPVDPAHPLLRHRGTTWSITGSWSVRLAGGGDRHTAHIHPQGIVSSALYCEIAGEFGSEDDQAGWLELGRSPPDLRVDLPPLASFRPRPGHLALFPSTLYHGTRPFAQGRRLTVAFDVTVAA